MVKVKIHVYSNIIFEVIELNKTKMTEKVKAKSHNVLTDVDYTIKLK